MTYNYKRPPLQYIAIDAEWRGTNESKEWHKLLGTQKVIEQFICLQARYIDRYRRRHYVMLLNECYSGLLETRAIVAAAAFCGFTDIAFVPTAELSGGLLHRLPGLDPAIAVAPCFFNSPLDLAYLVGVDNVKHWVEQKYLRKRRCYKTDSPKGGLATGAFKLSHIHDLVGLAPKTAEDAAASVGFATVDKAVSHGWDKGRMDLVLLRDPKGFMRYAKWDIDWIAHYVGEIPHLLNDVRQSVGLTTPWEFVSMPHTVGSVVYKMFCEWLTLQVPKLQEAHAALGRRVPGSRDGSLEAYSHGAIDSCSVPVLANRISSVKYAAVVLGGRCVNERPMHSLMRGRIADIDLKSCYGSSLAGLHYPLGLPSTYGGVRDDVGMTLGEFLAKRESEFVDGLWTITLGGTLPFDQNLLFSKRVTERDLTRAATAVFEDDGDSEDISKVPGIFTLATRVLENASLDCYSLEVIRKFSTSTELKGWMSLKVTCAVWYPQSLRAETADEWAEDVIDNPGVWTSTNDGIDTVQDKRNRRWYGVPLSGFIQPLLDRRAEVKHTNKPLSDAIKLPVNALYGDFATPYFTIGNAVLANNITGRARVGAWMMAMSLGGMQSITDGTAYDKDKVRALNPCASRFARPGFQTMYDVSLEGAPAMPGLSAKAWDEGASRGRYWTALDVQWEGLTPWDKGFDPCNLAAYTKALDEAATKHINAFFAHYYLRLAFAVEHKPEHFATKWATYGKSDYAFKLHDGETQFKVRGGQDFSKDPHSKLVRNTRFEMLQAIIDGAKVTTDMHYHTSKPVTPNTWLKLTADKQQQTFVGLYEVAEHEFNLRISSLPFASIDDYLAWDSMNKRKRESAKLNEWRTEPHKIASRGYQLTRGKKRKDIK